MGIEEQLRTIEKEKSIKILYACEAGSRAYHFSTENSDYDIRFIYRHPVSQYLGLNSVEDAISYQSDCYDIQGWDFKKTLLLAHKSNPTLYEWMLSPIVYKSLDESMEKLKQLFLQECSTKTLVTHYLRMAKRNALMQGETGKHSFLIHSVRSVLMAESLIGGRKPTLSIWKLVEDSAVFTKSELDSLFGLKIEGQHMNAASFTKEWNRKITSYIKMVEDKGMELLPFLPEKKPDIKRLEELFLQELDVKGEEDFSN